MKMIIAFAALVAVALAAPQGRDQEVVVLKEREHDNIGVGGYSYHYELSNGEKKEESASLVNEGTENEALRVVGSYSFVDPETNIEYKVQYVADENGFQPTGAHIPSAA